MSDIATKRLYRSEADKKIAGVCGGIADYLAVDSTVIRLVWLLLTLATGIVPGILAYILAAAVMPRQLPKQSV
ncbi:MAG TPA: PspC domain-containing protein [Candidatus Saccharimonadales bacterium]|nr:PspC domain-containing protein [Candidatus Saccharimonadales bacterium]